MKHFTLQHYRNIGIMAHIDAGKTTVTERILYYTGSIHKIGEVHKGDAVMDWMVQEQERGITITSAATSCQWNDHKINIIDTPGHVDFTVEVERCLRVLDGAIFLLDAKEGVEAQTEVVWRQANYYQVPRLIFVNKMDVTGADYYRSLNSIDKVLMGNPMPLQIPIGSEKDFEGIISLVDMKAYYYRGQYGQDLTVTEIPDQYRQDADFYRRQMIETLADYNDQVLLDYLEGRQPSEDLILETIRSACLKKAITPVLCGSAYKNKGVQNLLNAVIQYLPSPADRKTIVGQSIDGGSLERKTTLEAPFSALIFKIISDPFAGRLTYMRVYSGAVKAGGAVLNVSKNKKERLQKLLLMHANNRTEQERAAAGDIIATVGLKFSSTGDTLADMNAPILLESIDFPEPVIARAVEVKTPADYDRMQDALARLSEEDPTLVTRIHPDTGQTLISGMGELHLEIILDRLAKEFNIHVNSGKPQVTYRETIQEATLASYELSKQVGKQALYAYVELKVQPNNRGHGHTVVFNMPKRKIPKSYLEACEEGIRQSLQSGVLGGYEVIDMNIQIVDMVLHENNSSDVAFKTAGALALTEALKKGKSQILEPIFKVSVQVPDAYIGDVIDDINRRDGTITDMENTPSGRTLRASVPLSKLFGYATDLRSITRGHCHYTMIFSHFDHV